MVEHVQVAVVLSPHPSPRLPTTFPYFLSEWDDGVNEVWTNKILLAPNPNASSLVLEVWNKDEMQGDERIGAVGACYYRKAKYRYHTSYCTKQSNAMIAPYLF